MDLAGCIYKFMHMYRYNNNNNPRKIDYQFENWQGHGGKLEGRVLGKQIGGKGRKM